MLLFFRLSVTLVYCVEMDKKHISQTLYYGTFRFMLYTISNIDLTNYWHSGYIQESINQ